MSLKSARRLPIGAEPMSGGGVSFRVWAPKRKSLQVAVATEAEAAEQALAVDMEREANGYFSATVLNAVPGMVYGFRPAQGSRLVPDPASRFQPDGPTGLSQIVEPLSFQWSDDSWRGVRIAGQVLYELHCGTFTPEGTWQAAAQRLPALREAGMTVVELMPVADFLGTFGWGYDGVCMFAPTRLYGQPDDLRQFVDAAHAIGLGVILDVVYNHFGSFGNFVHEYSDDYQTQRYENEWGAPINFDGDNCGPVREFFASNVRYWIDEFHFDGFRFDATQSIYDSSAKHILAELQQAAREAAGERSLILLAENEPQNVRIVKPADADGFGFDALCSDDFHHTARVRLTGRAEAYYEDYHGSVDELALALKESYLYQGQISQHQKKRRGTPTRGLAATSFVHFLQNHDQVANSGTGARVHELTSPGRLRTMTALWLLSPQTPMFFQGQEFCASTPFHYFADMRGSDGRLIAGGRLEFLSQFPSLNTDEARRSIADPGSRATFEVSKLDWGDRERHRSSYHLHHDLLRLRRDEPVFRSQRWDQLETASLSADCLAVRYYEEQNDDRLLLANFGRLLMYSPSPLPLLAPPSGRRWELMWSTESIRYGGWGTAPVETDDGWRIPAEAAVVLRTVAAPIESELA